MTAKTWAWVFGFSVCMGNLFGVCLANKEHIPSIVILAILCFFCGMSSQWVGD